MRAGQPDPGTSERSDWPHLLPELGLRVLDLGDSRKATGKVWAVGSDSSGFKS